MIKLFTGKDTRSFTDKADVCLIVEGSYPYVQGGVSSWIHNLMRMHKDLKFCVASIIPPLYDETPRYQLPDNLIGIYNVYLQKMPPGRRLIGKRKKQEIIDTIMDCLLGIYLKKDIASFKRLLDYLKAESGLVGEQLLFNSDVSWEIIRRMYENTLDNSSFLDYFWSWKVLFGGLFSVLFADVPRASCYHSICTGYAGLYLAKAHYETGMPCLLTEHGIYTNERRIEISNADWLYDQSPFSLSVSGGISNTGLQGLWTEIFAVYSKFAYDVCRYILTLFEGNRRIQVADGADPARSFVIPNGIDVDKYNIPRKKHMRPTIALIGRVVQIKDIRTFINAVNLLKKSLPDILAYVIGSLDEEPAYADECLKLVRYTQSEDSIIFTGNRKIQELMGEIDVIVLTSLSEGQPLVILECGASGIPVVATDVGSCRELIYGAPGENPKLGDGGAVVPVSNPDAVASEIFLLLTDIERYNRCSDAIRRRVGTFYTSTLQHERYDRIYKELIF